MTYRATNFASSTLAVGLGGTVGDTTLQIQVGDVAKFPVINNGGSGVEFTMMVLTDTAKNREVIKVTRHDNGSSSFTVERAQEGTSARVWQAGDSVSVRLTAGVVTQTYTHPSQATGAHAATAISFAPTGGIGSTDVQAAIAELDTEKSPVGHTHAAGAITFTPAGNIAATTVQAAIQELDSEKISAGVATSSGLTVSATDRILGRSTAGAGAIEEITCTAAGRALLDDADAAAQRTTLGLGSAATLTAGTSANNVVQLDGLARLPAVDGSQLTNINAGLSAASTAEAQAGTIDTKAITPLKLREGLNASGSAPIYACRAWVNFNGTDTVAIRASGNVSSITDNNTGDYTVNFTTAMPDANYSVALTSGIFGSTTVHANIDSCTIGNKTTSGARCFVRTQVAAFDPSQFDVAIFR